MQNGGSRGPGLDAAVYDLHCLKLRSERVWVKPRYHKMPGLVAVKLA